MVETIKCELCGTETRYYVTKEIDGREMNFCCRGCLEVFEMRREENQQQQAQNEAGGKGSNGGL